MMPVDEGDSDPWPLRCEREKIYAKARCHNHLDFLRASELPHFNCNMLAFQNDVALRRRVITT
jgi:hypothetical protein